jgi:hypothetical protein
MARESKTVQVYPDDAIVNNTIAEYESFGWELISNQRCQEFTGQTHDSDGGTTTHYSTFNKLTFSREKDSVWYKDMVALENKLSDVRNESASIKKKRPTYAGMNKLVAVILFPTLLFFIFYVTYHKKQKKQYTENLKIWNAQYSSRLKELDEEEYETIQKASEIVNG